MSNPYDAPQSPADNSSRRRVGIWAVVAIVGLFALGVAMVFVLLFSDAPTPVAVPPKAVIELQNGDEDPALQLEAEAYPSRN